MEHPELIPSLTSGSVVQGGAKYQDWRLEIPAGPAGRYRLAQVDDYHHSRRKDFPWRLPLSLGLRARVSQAEIPGTWGFGLWNDPFSLAVLGGQGARRLPSLPQCAWFFYAGRPNWLSLREDRPGDGLLAATFGTLETSEGSPRIGNRIGRLGDRAALLAALPLLALLPAGGSWLRQVILRTVQQDAARLPIDPTIWHSYRVDLRAEAVTFAVDEECMLETTVAPGGPLGCVVWIDNQYLAFPPRGGIRYGMLASTAPAWLEVEGLEIQAG